MKREYFPFVIGFKDTYAIVNMNLYKKMHNEIKDKETFQGAKCLLNRGFLKSSFALALYGYEIEKKDITDYIDYFNTMTMLNMDIENIKRLLGVYKVPNIKNYNFV